MRKSPSNSVIDGLQGKSYDWGLKQGENCWNIAFKNHSRNTYSDGYTTDSGEWHKGRSSWACEVL